MIRRAQQGDQSFLFKIPYSDFSSSGSGKDTNPENMRQEKDCLEEQKTTTACFKTKEDISHC